MFDNRSLARLNRWLKHHRSKNFRALQCAHLEFSCPVPWNITWQSFKCMVVYAICYFYTPQVHFDLWVLLERLNIKSWCCPTSCPDALILASKVKHPLICQLRSWMGRLSTQSKPWHLWIRAPHLLLLHVKVLGLETEKYCDTLFLCCLGSLPTRSRSDSPFNALTLLCAFNCQQGLQPRHMTHMTIESFHEIYTMWWRCCARRGDCWFPMFPRSVWVHMERETADAHCVPTCSVQGLWNHVCCHAILLLICHVLHFALTGALSVQSSVPDASEPPQSQSEPHWRATGASIWPTSSSTASYRTGWQCWVRPKGPTFWRST